MKKIERSEDDIKEIADWLEIEKRAPVTVLYDTKGGGIYKYLYWNRGLDKYDIFDAVGYVTDRRDLTEAIRKFESWEPRKVVL